MVGLFDRPAPKAALEALLAEPAIPGLTDAFHGISAHERATRWAWAVRRLRAMKLLNREDERDPGALDAHPVVREHFAAELKEKAPEAHTAAHGRLYDFYRLAFLRSLDLPQPLRTPEAYGLLALVAAYPQVRDQVGSVIESKSWPNGWRAELSPTLLQENWPALEQAAALTGTPAFDAALEKFLPEDEAGMQPCFAAIGHGCAAGRHEEAWAEVYRPRVRRGNVDFAAKRLGLCGADLSALAQFFDAPFAAPSPRLAPVRCALALNCASFSLRALGRLAEAVEPLREGAGLQARMGDFDNGASALGNLSELLLALGRVGEAERAGADSAAHADRSGDAFQRMNSRTAHADVLHQAGEIARAAALFAEAERLHAERQPDLPRLYFGGWLPVLRSAPGARQRR